MAEKDKETWEICESPLKSWPGRFLLPPLDEINGEDWDLWRKCVDKAPGDTGLNRLYCYAGLAFIKERGKWELEIPLAEVQGWQTNKKAERLRLVGWIGVRVQTYIEEIVNPKG